MFTFNVIYLLWLNNIKVYVLSITEGSYIKRIEFSRSCDILHLKAHKCIFFFAKLKEKPHFLVFWYLWPVARQLVYLIIGTHISTYLYCRNKNFMSVLTASHFSFETSYIIIITYININTTAARLYRNIQLQLSIYRYLLPRNIIYRLLPGLPRRLLFDRSMVYTFYHPAAILYLYYKTARRHHHVAATIFRHDIIT